MCVKTKERLSEKLWLSTSNDYSTGRNYSIRQVWHWCFNILSHFKIENKAEQSPNWLFWRYQHSLTQNFASVPIVSNFSTLLNLRMSNIYICFSHTHHIVNSLKKWLHFMPCFHSLFLPSLAPFQYLPSMDLAQNGPWVSACWVTYLH